MKKFFYNLKKYRKYAIRSAKSELKSEVADSYLNWLWWIIEPLCFMMIYVFIFGFVFKNNELYFASFVFIGQTAWEFFNRMLTGSVNLVINNRDLVTKVYLPKYILLLAKSFTYLFKMCISLTITFIIMYFQNVPLTWNMLYLIPIFFTLYIVTFGIGLLLMNFGVFFNDLSNLTNIFLKMLFYLSGIFFNIRKRLSGKPFFAFFLLKVNPIAYCINELRNVMLYGKGMSFVGIGFWLFLGVLLVILGVRVINKYENSYAKVI